ncbi:MAG TPA: YoaK family protein [Solirubrobacteraceae bacterium]|jgi:uncharacterized membrane protein YoaK (UPF0700 family)|nr:YoaK family protein [Solirubrobacteraceae bacterium]
MLLALTFTTGLVDAACYLGLGRVFAANMTGNVVLLGFGIAGGAKLPVVAPLVSLGAFALGAGGGGVLAARTAERRIAQVARAVMIEIAFLIVAAVLVAVMTVRAGRASGYLVIAVLAFGMGVRNATARSVSVPDLNTTVLTMTITALASGLPLFGGTGKGTLRRSSAVVSMFGGALIGALLLKTALVWPLVLGAALNAVALPVYVRASRA